MFSRRLPLADLVALCRALRHNLAAGVALLRVLRQQAERGPRAARPLAARLAAAVEAGVSLGDALDREQDVVPPLFLAMVKLGDETGHLPEIVGELEEYYQLELKLRRRIRTRSFLPIAQFVLAVLVIAGLIFVLGVLAGGGRPLLSFFGLSGAAGALAFLAAVGGTLALVFLLWRGLALWGRERAAAERLLLRVPSVGPCLEALALSRFALALQLTLDSSLPIAKALRLSLRATGNAAYVVIADGVARVLKAGRSLYEALADSRLFSEEFLQVIATAEEAGSVPEAMRQQARYYQEEAARRLTALAGAASMGLWVLYAGFMIWAIFRIAQVYLSALGI
jgi:type IV pilus assembly protein PilC